MKNTRSVMFIKGFLDPLEDGANCSAKILFIKEPKKLVSDKCHSQEELVPSWVNTFQVSNILLSATRATTSTKPSSPVPSQISFSRLCSAYPNWSRYP